MDGGDGGDDRTFRANFTSEGVVKLRECVEDKLKEFMGDYTDDTLVEYVIVLLKNGRRKEEAKSELDVFLGDDSDPFVTWLWDHLGSNINLYVQPEGVTKVKAMESESEKEKSKTRHRREWKSRVGDMEINQTLVPTLKSSITDINGEKEETHHRKSLSPRSVAQRKRNRSSERLHNKREIVSQATLNVPRRLLQFAVRDAVGPSRTLNIPTEPSLKRLRSVVLAGSEENHPQKIQSVTQISNTMTNTAIKAVAEASNDVKRTKNRPSRNVFDRLGLAVNSNVSDNMEFDGNYVPMEVSRSIPIISRTVKSSLEVNEGLKIQNKAVTSEKKNKPSMLGNGNVNSETNNVKDVQKIQSSNTGNYLTGPPTEDVDARTIFVNNVHFAATKDSLSRHFNKFGEVVKVVILTDPATGLPKGSAYVEFMRKEAGEQALSLDGTSFMSRILKVVKKSLAPVESVGGPTLVWGRGGRGVYPSFGRGVVSSTVAYGRGVGGIMNPNVYRARPTMKVGGVRSMQWKRGDSTTTTTSSTTSQPPRGLTYVRTETKTNGNGNGNGNAE